MSARRLAALAVALLAVVAPAPAFAAEPPPPPGANDPSCRPTAEHPRPVVLVHGTFANRQNNWSYLAPQLAGEGYCVWALNYGKTRQGGEVSYGMAPMAGSAGEVAAFVDQVLATTGATEVDIVGHSQGGMLPRYWFKHGDGAAKVNALIGIAPANHGTTQPTGDPRWCAACAELAHDSEFMTELNSDGDTVPGVTYTVVATRYDQVVTPYTSQFLDGPAVTNITIQDKCAADPVDHAGMAYDPLVAHEVRNALDPARATPVTCMG